MLFIGLAFLLYVSVVVTQTPTRVTQFVVNSAINSQFTIALTGLEVYRDDLVVLGAYGRVIGVRADNLSVVNSLFDPVNLTNLYITVDDDTGVIGVCTNREGRCQWMNVTTFQVLGSGDGLILSGEFGVEVDERVPLILANTQGNVPSLFTASGNGVTRGLSSSQLYPIRTTQLQPQLSKAADLVGSPPNPDSFRRTYISAFKSGGYIYFVTLDQINLDFTIDITRICEDDSLVGTSFHSIYYTRLMECGSSPSEVLDARLTMLNSGISYEEFVVITYICIRAGIAFTCAYSLQSINQAMYNAYQDCYVEDQGSIQTPGIFLAEVTVSCSQTDSSNTECNLFPVGGGSSEVHLSTAAVSGTLITSRLSIKIFVATATQQDNGTSHTYYFVADGTVIEKYLMNGLSLIEPALETITLTESDSVTDLKLDRSERTLFAITDRQLFRVPVADCGRHSTCEECVSDRDPMCGWCGIQNTCTRLSQCANYNLTNRWIRDDTTSCFSISQVSPNISNINLGNSVSISAVNLPQLSQSSTFQCVFGSLGTSTVSQVSGGFLSGPVQGPVTLICPFPTGLSPFTQSAGTTFQFSLSSTEFPSTSLFREFSFTLFDCSFHSNCSSCVSQSDTSECGWCPYSGECHHTDTLCPLTMSMGGQLEYVWIQDDTCPDLNVDSSTDSFAVESSHSITLQGSNLQPPVDNFSYQCSLNVSGSVTTLSADYVSSSSLSCAIPANTFSIQYPDVLSAVLSITLGTTALPLLSPTIRVYNCSLQGDSCSACLTNRRRSADQCGWCDGQSLCTATQLCSRMFLVDSCPDPIIRSISPPSISAEYTGNIVIIGEHLGTADEVVSVSASTNPPSATFGCVNVMQNLQTIGREINCRFTGMLRVFFTNPGQSSTTTLSLTAGNATSNGYPFYIAFPLIRSVVPSFGPVAGGTRVIVSGIGLGTGLTRSADILGSAGVLANCTSITNPSSNDGELVCITEPLSENINSGQFRVTIDGLPYLSTTGLFEFRSNPNVQSINPTAVIPSSSFNITFTGTSLNAAASPVILFPSDPQPMPCFNATLTELICPFPSSIASSRKRQSAVDFTLKFDGFEVSNPQNGISLIPDPTFTPITATFPENVQSSADPVTTSIFLLLSGDTDYSEYGLADLFTVLLVGNGENITLPSSYQTDRIRAEIVNLQVEGTTTKTYTINVTLGEYRTEAGRVIILSTLESLQGFLIGTGVSAILIIIVIPLCVIMVMLFVSSVHHCYSKHKRKVRKTTLKRMTQLEMKNIEKMYSKKGYSQLVSENEGVTGVETPFLSFHRFVLNFLFPKQPNHPVLYPAKIPADKDEKEFRKALEMFYELLRDRDYFVSFVHCIESNRYFSLRDRSNIAGLFALCMYDEIEYLTAVLKTLLTDLTERMVSYSRAKLMFKRNESVAEKLLSDWLALLMYNHLVEGAGPAIHTAFSAMKTLTEKGPVDVFTGEAMYCLAEDKILRQVTGTDNVQEVTVEVRTEDGERMGVNILRCDSITQVKLKIMDVMYHSVPVSQRPPVTELNLEAHSPRMEGSGMILRDRDRTCQVSDGWRRINTMSHYGTFSQVFKLVPRTHKVHGGHEQDYVGTLIQDNFLNADTNNPLMRDDRVWHLVPSPHLANIRDNTKLSNEQLMRLSATKDSVQKYVDDMVSAIFPDVFLHPHLLPPPIKFLFDFLERQTEGHNIDNVADVIRQWKNNSVPLGFWVTLIKNPHYLFDVIRSGTMDSNLAVMEHILIDSCTCRESHIAKTNKENLLYDKEIQIYREKILSFYSSVTEAPPVTEEALFSSYQVPRGGEHFYRESALQALYSYAHSCKDKLLEVMQDDRRFDQQVSKFKEIYDILS